MDIKVENDDRYRQPNLNFCQPIFLKSHIDYDFKVNILFEPIARTGNLKPLVSMEYKPYFCFDYCLNSHIFNKIKHYSINKPYCSAALMWY